MTLDELRVALPDAVHLPGDRDFADLARAGHRTGAPRAVVRPADAAGVAAAVRYAAAEGLPVAVRSGGHTEWGTNDDGLVIHLGALDAVEVGEGGRVRVGGGAVWGDIAETLAGHGLALTSGDTASVGVGGLTLGGGFGWLLRKHGLALDSLVGAELVTAAGEIVRADAETNPELFWALRGGGGNFGVVTAFEFRAHPLEGVVSGTLSFARESLAEVLRVWRDLARDAPDELTATVLAMPGFGPEMPASLQIVVVWAGTDVAAARAAAAPLLEHPALLGGELAPAAYRSLLEEPPPEMGQEMPPLVDESSLLRDFDDATIDAVAGLVLAAESMMLMLRSLGGAYGRVAREETAFAHRDARVFAIAVTFLPPDAPADAEAGIRAAWSAAVGHELLGSYGNFKPATSAEIVRSMYPPATLERLREVKRAWDPGNVFAANHNIAP